VHRRERIVAIDDEAVALCPFAARVPFHLQIVPRRPVARFSDDGPLGSRLLHDTLSRLGAALGTLPPLNMWVRTAPRDAQRFCWRIEILPRLSQLAGLEIGTGVHLNVLAPEDAAERLRAASV
jgi:UDPglucose--hexose-1-phosphate uridylyltransferase